MADNGSQKFRGKYRIPSARLAGWDYASPGAYFITICTAGRAHLFGTVRDGQMILSPLGKIVYEEWKKSFAIRQELECDAFVIMPNHIHAIVRIVIGTDGQNVLIRRRQPTPPTRPKTGVAYRAPKSISSFVAGFKSAATKRINEYRGIPGEPVWQARFHDHIIRNQQEYERIATYIRANPANWGQDSYFNKE